jgi:hypothetical protein
MQLLGIVLSGANEVFGFRNCYLSIIKIEYVNENFNSK